ncbi:MAG: ATP-binding protein [Leptospiraceae bacterium]|nr:ATP-binding protein [Leptospiraceae bacterium]
MTQESRAGELPYTDARDRLEAELERYARQSGQSTLEIPKLSFEKGETRFEFLPEDLPEEMVLSALKVIKTHIEHIRIHTMDPGYVVFQSMGPNLYETKNYLSGIKFKFVSITNNYRVEVSRSGNFDQTELQTSIELFQLFHPARKESDPTKKLEQLGVTVFPPEVSGEEKQATGSSPGSEGTSGESIWGPIAGYDSIKREVEECLLLPARHMSVFEGVARLTRGDGAVNLPGAILFEGPPGVGKTTMARLAAKAAGLPLIYVPVENILSKFYGQSAQNLASIFDNASLFERGILFLDEIDSLATSRESGLFEATRRVLSVLLRKIDGLERAGSLLTVGATNRAEDLDHALLSRFDQILRFPLPNEQERASIFRSYAAHLNPEALSALGKESEGLSGRTIQDICESAERRWARQLIEKKQALSSPDPETYIRVLREKRASLA